MYLRIIRGRFDPARYDDLLPLSQQIRAAVQALPGCQSLHSGIDRTGGRRASVTTWDTAEHATFAREPGSGVGELIRRTEAIGVQLEPQRSTRSPPKSSRSPLPTARPWPVLGALLFGASHQRALPVRAAKIPHLHDASRGARW